MPDVKISDMSSAAALDGTELTPVVQGGATLSAEISQIKDYIEGGVKVYRALLAQTGTDAPVATVLENTLGGAVVWTRSSSGQYLGTLAAAFLVGKVFALCSPVNSDVPYLMTVARNNDNSVAVKTSDGAFAFADDILSASAVEILVYP